MKHADFKLIGQNLFQWVPEMISVKYYPKSFVSVNGEQSKINRRMAVIDFLHRSVLLERLM